MPGEVRCTLVFLLSSGLSSLTAFAGRVLQSPLAFTATASLLAALLVPGAFLRGEVLSQGTLLNEHQPWQAHAAENAAAANPLLYDAAYLFYPLLTHAVEAVRRGELPVWSTALYGGHPFLASFQTALFSPFTAIALAVPLPYATVVKALAPLVVGGLGMFLFIRLLGLSAAASWLAGLAYLLNGFAVAWMEHPLTAVACWLPWILHATERLIAQRSPQRVAQLAALIALAILAGHPETTAKVLLVTGAYAATFLAARHGRAWAVGAAAYAAGVLLTSVQLLPFLEYLQQSEALLSRETQALNTYFLPGAMTVGALVPDFFGNPVHGAYHVPSNRYGVVANYAEGALYAGMAVVILAPLGLATRAREWRVRFFAVSAVVSLGLMFGVPGLVHVVSAVPFLRVMILTRFGLVAITSLIVLAAYGADALARDRRGGDRHPRRVLLMTACAATAAIAIAWGAGLDFLRQHGLADQATAACMAAIALLVLSAGVTLARLHRMLSPAPFAVLVCTLLIADLLAAGWNFHPTIPARQVYPPIPEVDLVRQDPGLFRVYGWDNALVPNAAMAYGLQDARGWDGMNPHRWTRLLDLGYLRQTTQPERHLADPVLLDLLNVKYVFVGPGVSLPAPRYMRVPGTRAPLYVNTRAFPRAFLVNEYRVLDDTGLRAALHDGSVDLARVALLEEELPESERPDHGTGSEAGTVEIRHYRDTFVEVEVGTDAAALLVVSDAYYPGWVAAVDGEPVPIRRANFALRAVAVPAGRHVVRFEYRPMSVRIGGIVSGVTLVAIVGMLAAGRRGWRGASR